MMDEPAASEAFGLVLVEALACGTPVVGYADGAIPEVIDDPGIGRLFHQLEAEELAAALLEALVLAGRPETAQRCRARAQAFFHRALHSGLPGAVSRAGAANPAARNGLITATNP